MSDPSYAAHAIATQISRATLAAADFELILSALASKVRDTFNQCATDDAVESLDMAAEHINGLREYTHEERRAHTLAHYTEELRKARMEAA